MSMSPQEKAAARLHVLRTPSVGVTPHQLTCSCAECATLRDIEATPGNWFGTFIGSVQVAARDGLNGLIEARDLAAHPGLTAAGRYAMVLRKLADLPLLSLSDALRQVAEKAGWRPDPFGNRCDDALITLIEDLNKRGL